jgi:hypothetical protein
LGVTSSFIKRERERESGEEKRREEKRVDDGGISIEFKTT